MRLGLVNPFLHRRNRSSNLFLAGDGYRGTYQSLATVATGGSYTLASCDIGRSHANRVVTLLINTGPAVVTGVSDVTVNGSACTRRAGSGAVFQIWDVALGAASGATMADIVVANTSGSNMTRLSVSVVTVYPASATPIDAVLSAQANTTLTATASDIEVVTGGPLIVFGGYGAQATGNPLAPTWNGVDTPVADFNNVLGSFGSLYVGRLTATESNTTRDLTLPATVIGAKFIGGISYAA